MEQRGKRKPALLVAAESIALASGMVETVADVVRTRALRHYGEGLRQYLTIRLQSMLMGDRAMNFLRERLSAWSSTELLEGPGPRAHLYKLAREISDDLENAAAQYSCDLAWQSHQKQAGDSYREALTRLRTELSPDDAELLELHHARELTLEEMAHVLQGSVAKHGYQVTDPATVLSEAFDVDRNLWRKQSVGSANPDQLRQLLHDQSTRYQQSAADWDDRERTVRDRLSRLADDLEEGRQDA